MPTELDPIEIHNALRDGDIDDTVEITSNPQRTPSIAHLVSCELYDSPASPLGSIMRYLAARCETDEAADDLLRRLAANIFDSYKDRLE